MTRHVLPHIGDKPVSSVTSREIPRYAAAHLAQPPRRRGGVRQRINVVMDWALVMEYQARQPVHAGRIWSSASRTTSWSTCVPFRTVRWRGAIRKMWGSGATRPVKLAFEFLVLTAARSGEVRGARWADVDLHACVWTIPAKRMKSKREHPDSAV